MVQCNTLPNRPRVELRTKGRQGARNGKNPRTHPCLSWQFGTVRRAKGWKGQTMPEKGMPFTPLNDTFSQYP